MAYRPLRSSRATVSPTLAPRPGRSRSQRFGVPRSARQFGLFGRRDRGSTDLSRDSRSLAASVHVARTRLECVSRGHSRRRSGSRVLRHDLARTSGNHWGAASASRVAKDGAIPETPRGRATAMLENAQSVAIRRLTEAVGLDKFHDAGLGPTLEVDREPQGSRSLHMPATRPSVTGREAPGDQRDVRPGLLCCKSSNDGAINLIV